MFVRMTRCQLHVNAMLLLLGVLVVPCNLACQSNTASAGDPARVQVRETSQGLTVVGSQGELLRGSAIAVYKFRRDQVGTPDGPATDYALDPAYWDQMKAAGVNAVRLVWFDPWQRSHGDPALDPFKPYPYMPLFADDVFVQGMRQPGNTVAAERLIATEKAKLLRDFDRIVNMASARDMYVMINYHDLFGYSDPDHEAGIAPGESQFSYKPTRRYLRAFWAMIANRYHDRTHVFFELMNEPVGFHPNDYSTRDIRSIASLYNEVRARAPDTHIVLGSFVTPAHFGNRSMRVIARLLRDEGVDFTNASVGYHGYDISSALPHDPQDVRLVSRIFPLINTELNFPSYVDDGVDDPPAPGYFDDELAFESMERLNISWFAWNTLGPQEFTANFDGIIRPDAVARGYDWKPELQMARRLNRLQADGSPAALATYAALQQVFLAWTDM